jgi:hypothetical protein
MTDGGSPGRPAQIAAPTFWAHTSLSALARRRHRWIHPSSRRAVNGPPAATDARAGPRFAPQTPPPTIGTLPALSIARAFQFPRAIDHRPPEARAQRALPGRPAASDRADVQGDATAGDLI